MFTLTTSGEVLPASKITTCQISSNCEGVNFEDAHSKQQDI
jgi:hypothetical protein